MTDHEAAKKARAEYAREYRKRNPEKVKQAQLRYWSRKAQQTAEKKEDGQREN